MLNLVAILFSEFLYLANSSVPEQLNGRGRRKLNLQKSKVLLTKQKGVALERYFFGLSERHKNIGTDQIWGNSFSGRTAKPHDKALSLNTDKTLLKASYCVSIFLNQHAVGMFNESLFSFGDFENRSAYPTHTLRRL